MLIETFHTSFAAKAELNGSGELIRSPKMLYLSFSNLAGRPKAGPEALGEFLRPPPALGARGLPSSHPTPHICTAEIWKKMYEKSIFFLKVSKILVESMIWRDRNSKFGPNYDLEVDNLENKIIHLQIITWAKF